MVPSPAGTLESVEEKDSLAQVWDKRLGHISEMGLHVLEKQELFGKKSLAFGKHLEEKHMTWARFVKKLDKNTTFQACDFHSDAFTKSAQKAQLVGNEMVRVEIPREIPSVDELEPQPLPKFPSLDINLGDKRRADPPINPYSQGSKNDDVTTKCDGVTIVDKKNPLEQGFQDWDPTYDLFCLCKIGIEFEQLCTESRIAKHLTFVGMPQQNGLAELMNKTLMDKVEVELQGLNNRTLEEDQIDPEDGDDEDAGDQETDQTPDLTDYQLVRDIELRTRTKPLRFRDESNIAAYAFAAAEEEDTREPLAYQEAVTYEGSFKWKAAMKEEMDSLRKNKTWELVDHPAG
ncbi:retrotransposon protein, putative, ty1-copia subclass [Tanacetum coccineum]|uniref:Retrotransposon protein, putative, ty1-copia subclass n=1 Tax=Tanacetum coccineum TaxID=301880 RepID=A0ABQ5CZN6_9ASTR